MQPRYDANGQLSFWFILPSKALRRIVYRRLREAFPELNYCCEWRDKNGWGINLAVAEWMKNQPYSRMYHVPN